MMTYATASAWRQARKIGITERTLLEASHKANDGLVDAKLGAHLYKQRIGRKGDFRLILYHIKDRRCVVLHIFPKNVQPNISGDELKTLRDFVAVLDRLSDENFVTASRERGWKDLTDEKRDANL